MKTGGKELGSSCFAGMETEACRFGSGGQRSFGFPALGTIG